MRSVPRWVTAGFGLAVVWLFVAETQGTPRALLAGLIVGLVLSLPVTYGFRALFPGRSDLSRAPAVVPAAVKYVVVFVYELLTANIEVAKVVLAPSMPLDPGVVVIPLRVESDAAITVIANSITLTPGTLTMDYDAEENALHVHAVDASDVKGLVDPVRRWERYALIIFDEETDPDAPAPEPGRLEVNDE